MAVIYCSLGGWGYVGAEAEVGKLELKLEGEGEGDRRSDVSLETLPEEEAKRPSPSAKTTLEPWTW